MPRLFLTKESTVIFRSSLILGLCRSVFSMIIENAKMNAVSAVANTLGFCFE